MEIAPDEDLFDEIKVWRRAFIGLLASLTVIHFAAIYSVLPYVYVTDDKANCGARMIIDHAVSELWFMFLLSLIYTALHQGIGALLRIRPNGWAAEAVKSGEGMLRLGALPGIIAFTLLMGVALKDMTLASHLPALPSDVAACAHPPIVAGS